MSSILRFLVCFNETQFLNRLCFGTIAGGLAGTIIGMQKVYSHYYQHGTPLMLNDFVVTTEMILFYSLFGAGVGSIAMIIYPLPFVASVLATLTMLVARQKTIFTVPQLLQ